MQVEPSWTAFEQAVSCWFGEGNPHQIEESWLVRDCPFLATGRLVRCDFPPAAEETLQRLTDERDTRQLFAGQPSKLQDAATNMLFSLSDGESDPSDEDSRRLAMLLSGLAYTLPAANAIVRRDDASALKFTVMAMGGLSQAWPIDLRDNWQPEKSLPDSLMIAKPNASTRLLYALARAENFQQAANDMQINLSGWLMFERLLRYLLKEDELDVADEHEVTAKVLLYNRKRRQGHVCPFRINAVSASLSGAFVDPVASGLMIGDGDMLRSLQFASQISREKLLSRAQVENRQLALRVAPNPPTDYSGCLPPRIEGASGGLILACGLYAAAERRPLNRNATATAQLSIDDVSADDRLLWNDQIQVRAVLSESVPKKFKSARREGIEHVALYPAQADQFKDHTDAQGLNVVGVATFLEAYQFLTSDAELDGVLRRYGEAIVKRWQEDVEQKEGEHRIDRFVYPSFSVMPDGRTPFARPERAQWEADAESLGESTYEPIKATDNAGHFAALHSGRWQCWIEDAGAGKSVFAWKTQELLSSPEGQREFFQGKPCLAVWWEGYWPRFEKDSDGFKSLATGLRDELLKHDRTLAESEAQRTVEYALREGRVVLIIDALDQFTEPHLRQLKSVFASDPSIKNCRVILTSRAYKVHDEQTFFDAATWRYGRIDGFITEAQRDATDARPLANSDRWHWAWRTAIELPPEARQPAVLCRSLAQLFERPKEGLRPTELMFRCWHLFEREPFEPIRRELPDAAPLPDADGVVRQWRSQLWEQFAKADVFQRDELLRLFPEDLLLDLLNAADDDSAAAIQRDVFDFNVEQVHQIREWLTHYRETLTTRSRAGRHGANADLARAYYRCPPQQGLQTLTSPTEPFAIQSFTVKTRNTQGFLDKERSTLTS